MGRVFSGTRPAPLLMGRGSILINGFETGLEIFFKTRDGFGAGSSIASPRPAPPHPVPFIIYEYITYNIYSTHPPSPISIHTLIIGFEAVPDCFSRADLKSTEERRSCRVEQSRVELEELEEIGAESTNAVWFQREKRLNCCCLNKYKARNSDSIIRSVGESALTMEILVVNKFRTSVVK